MTLRVGITGHRPNHPGLRAHIEDITARCRQALAMIDDATGIVPNARRSRIVLVSGLAEGADQIALACRPRGWSIEALLPLPLDGYRRDFSDPKRRCLDDAEQRFDSALALCETVVELPKMPGSSEAAPYARLGRELLHRIDLLLAVWDGESSRGPGGTAEVVDAALESNIPVAWLPIASGQSLRLLVRSGDQRTGRLADSAALRQIITAAVAKRG